MKCWKSLCITHSTDAALLFHLRQRYATNSAVAREIFYQSNLNRCIIQAIRVFFRTNQTTCQEWVNRMASAALMSSVRAGRHASAARFGLNLLSHWAQTRRTIGTNILDYKDKI